MDEQHWKCFDIPWCFFSSASINIPFSNLPNSFLFWRCFIKLHKTYSFKKRKFTSNINDVQLAKSSQLAHTPYPVLKSELVTGIGRGHLSQLLNPDDGARRQHGNENLNWQLWAYLSESKCCSLTETIDNISFRIYFVKDYVIPTYTVSQEM